MNRVLIERKGAVYLRQGADEQVEMGISTQDRSGLEDSVWESIAFRRRGRGREEEEEGGR